MGFFDFVSPFLGPVGGIIGGVLGNKSEDKRADQNVAYQREFAQNGIQWKVADAKKAGIHPLAAMGASTSQFTPTYSAGGTDYSKIGQDLGRAIHTSMSKEAKIEKAQQARLLAAQIDNQEIRNSILNKQLEGMDTPSPPEPRSQPEQYPLAGQSLSNDITGSKGHDINNLGRTASINPHYQFTLSPDEGHGQEARLIMTQDVGEIINENFPSKVGEVLRRGKYWAMRFHGKNARHYVKKFIKLHGPPPRGTYWHYNKFTGTCFAVPLKSIKTKSAPRKKAPYGAIDQRHIGP